MGRDVSGQPGTASRSQLQSRHVTAARLEPSLHFHQRLRYKHNTCLQLQAFLKQIHANHSWGGGDFFSLYFFFFFFSFSPSL